MPEGAWDGQIPREALDVDWDDNLKLDVQRVAGQVIDLTKLGTHLVGECSEERKFVQIFVRHETEKKTGRVVVGRKVYVEDFDEIPRGIRDIPHGDLVQGRTMWLGYLANLEEASTGDGTRSLQLTVNDDVTCNRDLVRRWSPAMAALMRHGNGLEETSPASIALGGSADAETMRAAIVFYTSGRIPDGTVQPLDGGGGEVKDV